MKDIYWGPLALFIIYAIVFIGILIDYINGKRKRA